MGAKKTNNQNKAFTSSSFAKLNKQPNNVFMNMQDRSFRNVSHSCCFDNVTDHKLANSFIFWAGPGAVGAANVLNMATAVLGTSIIPSFLCHPVFYKRRSTGKSDM